MTSCKKLRGWEHAALAVTAMLSACSFGPKDIPPVQRYTLNAPEVAAAADKLPYRLAVELPVTTGGLDTEKILLKRGGNRMDFYAGAVWRDDAPAMVQALLIAALERGGAFASVTDALAALRADILLVTELRDFQAEYTDNTGAPSVRVTLAAKLVNASDRSILASRIIEKRQPASGESLSEVIAAFDAALGVALSDAAGFAQTSLAAPPPAFAPPSVNP